MFYNHSQNRKQNEHVLQVCCIYISKRKITRSFTTLMKKDSKNERKAIIYFKYVDKIIILLKPIK